MKILTKLTDYAKYTFNELNRPNTELKYTNGKAVGAIIALGAATIIGIGMLNYKLNEKSNGPSSNKNKQSLEVKTESTENKEEFYVVQKGDTLSEIAEKYGASWKRLAVYNNIKNPDLIFQDQVIKIPRGKWNEK